MNLFQEREHYFQALLKDVTEAKVIEFYGSVDNYRRLVYKGIAWAQRERLNEAKSKR